MKRVASLYLPDWPIDRLRRAARTAAPPEAGAPTRVIDIKTAPRDGGWRPGARWARAEDAEPVLQRLRRDGGAQDSSPGNLGRGTAEGGGGGASKASVPRSPPSTIRKRNGWSPSPCSEEPSSALVTSIREGSKILIAAACPAAQALGIRPGMAVTQARAQVPGLDIRPADPAGDHEELTRLAIAAARHWSPIVALSDEDGLFIDLTGTAHLFDGEQAMARRIVRLLARLGFTARIAVADSAGAAWALARYGAYARPGICRDDGRVLLCPPGAHADAIATLPTIALRIEPAAIELLKRLGVDDIGQLAAMPRAPLVRRFGASMVARIDQALGRIGEPLDPVVPLEHIMICQRFAEPILTDEVIAHWLEQLVPRLTAKLGQAGRGARMIELVADRIDGKPQIVRIGVARASRDPTHLERLLLRRIETIDPGFGIDALTLHVRRSQPLGPQSFVERLDEETKPDLAPLVDTLATRIGTGRLWRMRPVESDVPERAAVRAPVLDPPERAAPSLKPGDVRQLDRTADLHPWHHRWPRPVRLLRRPEQLDHVIAELPDQPPRRFSWRGTMHRVVRADGPERVTGEWWKRAAEQHSVRDYFRVEDEEGQRFWLFRRGDGERGETGDLSWFMHGAFG